MLIPLGILAASGAASGAMELISTQLIASATSGVTFLSIPQTYKHLELRYTARSDWSSTGVFVNFTFNNDNNANYTTHRLVGNGSTVTSASSVGANSMSNAGHQVPGANSATSAFGAGIIDILDYTSTTKNKVMRVFSGSTNAYNVAMASGLWVNTAAISRIDLLMNSGNFTAGSRISLYGIKG